MAGDATIAAVWRGRLEYGRALAEQRAQREARLAGPAGDVLWLLEHEPVVTTGRREVVDLERVTVPIVETERGGLATFHGPGQLVGYLIADVTAHGHGVKSTIAAVEEGLIRWLARHGVTAGRASGRPGVWVGGDKVAAIGMHFRRGVSMHGFALNLTVDLRHFDEFVPCGLADAGVTSLQRLTGRSLPPEQAWESVADDVIAAIGARRQR